MKALALALATACVLAIGASRADAASSRGTIVVRTNGEVAFVDPAGCAVGRAIAPLVTLAGAPAGEVEVCYQTFVPGCNDRCRTLTGTAIWRLPSGTIGTTATNFEVALDASFSKAASFWSGRVTSGGSGVLRGAGTILFDPDGTPHPYIVFAISAR